jgi:hypothetical protein
MYLQYSLLMLNHLQIVKIIGIYFAQIARTLFANILNLILSVVQIIDFLGFVYTLDINSIKLIAKIVNYVLTLKSFSLIYHLIKILFLI